MHDSWIQREKGRSSIGDEIRHIRHDVMWVSVSNDVEIPVTIPAHKDFGKPTESAFGFFIIESRPHGLGSDGDSGAHDDKQARQDKGNC